MADAPRPPGRPQLTELSVETHQAPGPGGGPRDRAPAPGDRQGHSCPSCSRTSSAINLIISRRCTTAAGGGALEPLCSSGDLERREGTANVIVDRIERLDRPDLPPAKVTHIEPRRVWSSDAGELSAVLPAHTSAAAGRQYQRHGRSDSRRHIELGGPRVRQGGIRRSFRGSGRACRSCAALRAGRAELELLRGSRPEHGPRLGRGDAAGLSSTSRRHRAFRATPAGRLAAAGFARHGGDVGTGPGAADARARDRAGGAADRGDRPAGRGRQARQLPAPARPPSAPPATRSRSSIGWSRSSSRVSSPSSCATATGSTTAAARRRSTGSPTAA